MTERLGGVRGVRLIDPLPYPAMLEAMAAATLILSDSGGIQEEAPALGAPLLILRDTTERPESVQCGSAILAGTDPDAIFNWCTRLLDDPARLARMSHPRFPFGRGRASEKMLTVIENYLGA